MKKLFIALMCISFLFACKGPKGDKAEVSGEKEVETSTQAASHSINTGSSTVTWVGYKPGDDHNGTISLKSGNVNMEGNKVVGGNFVIDLSTITATDADMDEAGNTKLTNHLRSADFFNTDLNPTANFEITKVVKLSGSDLGTHTIHGNLDMNGNTKNVSFPATINCNGSTCTTTAEFNIDRTDWGIEFMSKKVLGELADRFVNDEITIGLNIVSGS